MSIEYKTEAYVNTNGDHVVKVTAKGLPLPEGWTRNDINALLMEQVNRSVCDAYKDISPCGREGTE